MSTYTAGKFITPEEHKRRLREQYIADSKKDPVFVPLGVRTRPVSLDERAYDKEVEYELDKEKHRQLADEVNGVEERKEGKKADNHNQLVEESLRQHEMTYAAHAAQRWDGQERWQGKERQEARKVNVLHYREFQRRLKRVGVEITFNDFSKLGRIGMNARVMDFDELGNCIGMAKKTVTTLQYPWSYEWSIMRFNEYNVPTQEKFRGWRTALLVLISYGVCTEAQAHEALGQPNGDASLFYREQLFNLRNKRGIYEKPVAVSAAMQGVGLQRRLLDLLKPNVVTHKQKRRKSHEGTGRFQRGSGQRSNKKDQPGIRKQRSQQRREHPALKGKRGKKRD